MYQDIGAWSESLLLMFAENMLVMAQFGLRSSSCLTVRIEEFVGCAGVMETCHGVLDKTAFRKLMVT